MRCTDCFTYSWIIRRDQLMQLEAIVRWHRLAPVAWAKWRHALYALWYAWPHRLPSRFHMRYRANKPRATLIYRYKLTKKCMRRWCSFLAGVRAEKAPPAPDPAEEEDAEGEEDGEEEEEEGEESLAPRPQGSVTRQTRLKATPSESIPCGTHHPSRSGRRGSPECIRRCGP